MHHLTERGWLAEGLGKQGVGRVHTDLRGWCRGGCWCQEPEKSPFGGQKRLGQPLQSPPSSASSSGWFTDIPVSAEQRLLPSRPRRAPTPAALGPDT